MVKMNGSGDAGGAELTITRTFDAPPAIVWITLTIPDLVMKWWGPRHYTCPFAMVDLRVGGRTLYCMQSPDGTDSWSTGIFREVFEPERIVATDSFSDVEGTIMPTSRYGMDGDWPAELLVTISLAKYDGKTRFTLKHAGFPDAR
jgi:uncharacterized protein YndB with AHSA1/START domain